MQQPNGSSFPDLRNLYYAQNQGQPIPAQETTIISCPKKMVGRVIGKNGETIKALQQFTGAQIQIDQRCDPTRVSIAGPPKSSQVATSMVQDIVAGTFKGFAMLRSFASQAAKTPDAIGFISQPLPVYIEGYGFVPPSQFYDPCETAAPVYQQNLHGFSSDPVSVLRAISPSNTSGSGGPSASPQGLPPAAASNLNALSAALAAQAQLYSLCSASPLQDMPTTSPSYNSPSFAQIPHFIQPPPASMGRHAQMANVARSLFAAEGQEACKAGNETPSSTSLPASSLPSLGNGKAVPTSQAAGVNVWSQLEKLSPDGGPASGSPLLAASHSPSRASSPAQKSQQGSAAGEHDPAALLAHLKALSLQFQSSGNPSPTKKQQQPGTQAFYSSGWPSAEAPPVAPALPQGWIQLAGPENRCFYHNVMTGESQYNQPSSLPNPADYLSANGNPGSHLPLNLFQ